MNAASIAALVVSAGPLPAQEEVHALHAVDRGPVLRGCSHVEPPATRVAVPVRFVIDAAGTVVPGSVRIFGGYHGIPTDLAIQAEAAARSCLYDPATIDGSPVAVRMRAEFHFGLQPSEARMMQAVDRARAAERRRS